MSGGGLLRRSSPTAQTLALLLASVSYGLGMVVATGLVPSWGRWYAYNPYHHAQVEALMRGNLALSHSPYDLMHDLVWTQSGVQQVWGLGVPLWHLPFAVIARLLFGSTFPDMLALAAALALSAWLVLRGFFDGAATDRRSRSESALAGLSLFGTILILLIFPPFTGLLRSPNFGPPDQVVSYEYAFCLALIGALSSLTVRPGRARYLVLCLLAGAGGLLRPTLVFYGVATVLAGVCALEPPERIRQPPVAARSPKMRRLWLLVQGGCAFGFGTLVLLVTNAVRFGSPLEFGHSLTLTEALGNVYATRFGHPYQNEPLLSAARELFGALFNEPNLGSFYSGEIGAHLYDRGLFPGQSETVRFREIYLKTYSLEYLWLLVGGVAAGLFPWLFQRVPRHVRESSGTSPRLQVILSLWGAIATAFLIVFYLRGPLLSSRYMLDFMAAFSALMVAFWLAVTDAVRRSRRALLLVPCLLATLVYWLGANITNSKAIAIKPHVLTRSEVQEEWRQTAGINPRMRPVSKSYDIFAGPSETGIYLNGAGWFDTGSVLPVVILFLQDPEFLELLVEHKGGTDARADLEQIRAKIDIEFLDRETVRETDYGWLVRFHGPVAPRYRRGLHSAFIAFAPETELAALETPWRLLMVRWGYDGSGSDVPPKS